MSLERKHSYVLTFSAEGYGSAEFQIRHEMRVGILVADVLLTGLIGVVVDAITGGWYKLEPKTAIVTLERAAANEGPDHDTIEVAITIQENKEGRELEIQASAAGVVMQVERR